MWVSSSNFSATLRKIFSRNSCKNLSTIQWSDQELWTSWAGTLCRPDQTPTGLMAISLRRQGNKPIGTPVKIWGRSNDRIKSYEPLEPMVRSMDESRVTNLLSRCSVRFLEWPDHTLVVSNSNSSATPRKTAFENSWKILARSNGRIKSYEPLKPVLLSRPWCGPTRLWGVKYQF